MVGGRYRLEELLGSGGTGEVWRATDERLDRPVAVKLLHPWAAADADLRSRFRREAAAMARLDHPNVVAVLDYGEDDRPWLVQALCTGGTLGNLIASSPLPWPRVVDVAVPIARALAHAHSQGVIHRDLKPSNVLFAADGHVLVGDFGLARLVASGEQTITATGTRMGSPEYWSPEQAAGEPVSERADLYSLGCILYQLATGVLPFPPGDDRLAAGFRRIHQEPPSALAIQPTLPPQADDLLRRLLARAPAARPRAADVLAALERGAALPADGSTAVTAVLQAPATLQRPAAPATMVAPGPPRPGFSLVTGVVALLLVVAGLLVAAIAAGQTDAIEVQRDGLDSVARVRQDDAQAGLAILGGAALATLGLALLALWSVRSAYRGRRATTRVAMTLLAVLACGLAAGALVWTAYAASADAGDLWDRAAL